MSFIFFAYFSTVVANTTQVVPPATKECQLVTKVTEAAAEVSAEAPTDVSAEAKSAPLEVTEEASKGSTEEKKKKKKKKGSKRNEVGSKIDWVGSKID